MSVELNTLITKVSDMDITLIAGEKGLSNPVSWVHMVETREATAFLKGGEIAFATGIGLNNGLTLLELIENTYIHKASGIILNTGPFLENISDDIIQFGNEHDFPIFTVPWKIHIAEIMRIFSYTIIKKGQKALQVAAAFKNALFFPKQEELYSVALTQNGFMPSWSYCACIIKAFDKDLNPLSPTRLENMSLSLEHYLSHDKFEHFAVFLNENNIVIVLGDYSEQEYIRAKECFLDYFSRYTDKSEIKYLGMGRLTKSVRCLYKSYNQAEAIARLHLHGKVDPSLVAYSDMGAYRLLMGIEDQDIITDYYNKTIRPLAKYDEKNNTNLCDILRVYLNKDGSVMETAKVFFVHRNTINYKLNKIAEILNVNLTSFDTRFQITLAFMLQDMLS